VQAVVNIAKSIGLNVLAEGVETQGQVNKLAEFGCYYCQGYFYAKPQPIDTFPKWLAEFKNKCV
jgi:EAL domain-containing protein (putative c-di-GMP-specific phosphodiesterase class I)